MRNSRLDRFTYCFTFFLLVEVGLFALLTLFGGSRPNSGQGFVGYCFIGPLGAWLQRFEIFSDFPWLGVFVAFVVNPVLYAVLLYPLVSLKNFQNKRSEIPTLKIPYE
jgi:hypothetical protein